MHLATIGPKNLIDPRYSSSFSAFFRNLETSDCSVKSTSFGHPPSTCRILVVFVITLSVFTDVSDLRVVIIFAKINIKPTFAVQCPIANC